MRLLDAIVEANHRALAGDSQAGLHPADFKDALPLVALTCIDPRLNRLLPEVLGVPEDEFIWLRNAGNIIFDPHSSMMRTLALACALKNGKEITVIGHTDCRVRQVSVSQLIDSFRALGIQRASLPDNLIEFFGLFASERQNVINGVTHIRQSPLISPKIPVHGLLVDIESGRLEWLVNGYDQLGAAVHVPSPLLQKVEQAKQVIGALADLRSGELKFPEVKIGDLTLDPRKWLSEIEAVKQNVEDTLKRAVPHEQPAPAAPPPIPIPPPIRLGKPPGRSKK
jgi:carbonic anhydrase